MQLECSSFQNPQATKLWAFPSWLPLHSFKHGGEEEGRDRWNLYGQQQIYFDCALELGFPCKRFRELRSLSALSSRTHAAAPCASSGWFSSFHTGSLVFRNSKSCLVFDIYS